MAGCWLYPWRSLCAADEHPKPLLSRGRGRLLNDSDRPGAGFLHRVRAPRAPCGGVPCVSATLPGSVWTDWAAEVRVWALFGRARARRSKCVCVGCATQPCENDAAARPCVRIGGLRAQSMRVYVTSLRPEYRSLGCSGLAVGSVRPCIWVWYPSHCDDSSGETRRGRDQSEVD